MLVCIDQSPIEISDIDFMDQLVELFDDALNINVKIITSVS